MATMTKSTPFPYTVDQVLQLAGVDSIDIRPQNNGRLKIKCKFYSPPGSKRVGRDDGHFSMEHETGKFNCFSRTHCQNCSMCDGGGSKLDFYAFYRGIGGHDGKSRRQNANREIYNILFRDKAPSTPTRKVPPPVVIPKLETTLAGTLTPEQVSAVFKDFLSMLDLSKAHRKLLRERGLTDKAIVGGGYKTFPQVGMRNIAALLARKHTLIGVPGFFMNKDEVVTLASFPSAFMIPYFTPGGLIAGIQLRFDVPLDRGVKSDGSKKLQRYIWFSSSSKDKGAQQFIDHCAGYSGFDINNPPKRVGLTEGKLKGDVANDLLKQMGKDIPMASIPGISMRVTFRNMIEYLLSIGVEEFIDYFDMDRYKNENVMKDIGKLYGVLEEYGIKPTFKPWNRNFKGIDDLALQAFKMDGGVEPAR